MKVRLSLEREGKESDMEERRRFTKRDYLWLSVVLALVVVSMPYGCAPALTPTETPMPAAPTPTDTPVPVAPTPTSTPVGPFGTITVLQGFDVNTTDPHQLNARFARGLLTHAFQGLVGIDADGQIVPLLAESWENPDDLTWTFHLRQDVQFHNGERFDASAAVYSLDRFVDPDINNNYAGDLAQMDSVEVVDDYTIKLTTKEPFSPLLEMLALVFMVPPEATESLGDDFGFQGIGTGPFKILEWVPGEHLTMEANEAYWGTIPRIKTVVWRPVDEPSTRLVELRTGAADIIYPMTVMDVPALEDTDAAPVTRESSWRLYVFLNCGKPPFDNKQVRQAVNYAVDKEQIVESLLQGAGYLLNGPLISGMEGYSEALDPYPYDPGRARELLAEGGYPDGFEFTLLTLSGRYVKDKEIAEAIAGYLGDVGIDVQVEVVEYGLFIEQVVSRESDAFSVGTTTLSTQGVYGSQLYSAEPGFAWQNYVNEEFDRLYKKAVGTMNASEREQTYQEATKLIRDDAPFIFLHSQQDIYGVNNRVEGFEPRVDGQIWLGSVSVSE